MILSHFFAGMACATFALSAVFFLKFWKASRDRFFLFLCTTLGLLSLERAVSVAIYYMLQAEAQSDHTRSWLYLIRLAAFLLILAAILDKNRQRGRRH